MKETEIGGYFITERLLDDGGYELSTTAFNMGERYKERRRYKHKPSLIDYTRFVQSVTNNQ